MEVAGALTAAFQERRTVSALAVSICHIAKFANDIFPFVASMEDSVTSVRYPGLRCFTNRIIFYKSLSHLFSILHTLRVFSYACLQNCEKRRTVRRTALNNVVSETSLPVTRYDTSFETLINTRQHAIQDIVRDALQQHGY